MLETATACVAVQTRTKCWKWCFKNSRSINHSHVNKNIFFIKWFLKNCTGFSRATGTCFFFSLNWGNRCFFYFKSSEKVTFFSIKRMFFNSFLMNAIPFSQNEVEIIPLNNCNFKQTSLIYLEIFPVAEEYRQSSEMMPISLWSVCVQLHTQVFPTGSH